MAVNQYDYNYITGRFYNSNIGTKYKQFGSSYGANYSWSVEFESVKISSAGVLASNTDGSDGWEISVDSEGRLCLYWGAGSGFRNTYTISTDYFKIWTGVFYNIKFEMTASSSNPTIKATVSGNSYTFNVQGREVYNYNRALAVGSSVTTIRGKVIITGYAYGTNTLSTATFDLDAMTQGATSVTVDGNTYSCPSIQHYSDPAPTVTASFTYTSATAISLTVTANASCNKWEYKVGSGSWTSFSTTTATSQTTSVTVSSTSTVSVRATKVGSGKTGTASVSVDRTAPTVSASAGNQGMTSCTLTATTNVNCDKWEYKIGSGSYTTFSTTNGKSASVSVTGLSAGTTYTFTVRVTNTVNWVTATTTASVTTIVDTPAVVTATITDTSATAVKLTATTDVDANKWEYKVGSGSYSTFSTTNGRSATANITSIASGTTATVTVRVTRTLNGVTSTGTASIDKTAPTVTASTSSVSANSFTLSASSNVNCNKWEYQLTSSSSWVTFSSTNGTSASASITGLSPATTYSINVRATKTSNYVTATASASATTLGYSTITSVANVNVDNATTVTFTPYSTSFYFKLVIKQGSTVRATENIGKRTSLDAYTYTTSYTFPASRLSTKTSETWTAVLYTYSDSGYSSEIGNNSKTFTVSVPNTATYKPSISSATLTPNNDNSWLASKNYWVGGYTKANVAITATAGSGASISSYSVTGDITGSTASFTSPVLSAGSKSVTIKVTDSRSRTATVTRSITVQQYISPSVTFTATRGTYSGSTWTASDSGEHIRVVATGTVSLTGNACTLYCTCAGNGNTYTGTTTSGTSATWYFTSTDAEHTYTINVWASDSLGTVGAKATTTVSTIEVALSWNYDRIGIGKVAENAKSLELADTWVFRGLQTAGAQYKSNDTFGINLKNSDIVGVNGIYTNDYSNAVDEAIHFARANGNWDSIYAYAGSPFFRPDHAIDQATDYYQIMTRREIGEWSTGYTDGVYIQRRITSRGLAETWASATLNVTSWTALGSLYRSGQSRLQSWTASLFEEYTKPVTMITAFSNAIAVIGTENYDTDFQWWVHAPRVYIMSPVNTYTGEVTINYYAYGMHFDKKNYAPPINSTSQDGITSTVYWQTGRTTFSGTRGTGGGQTTFKSASFDLPAGYYRMDVTVGSSNPKPCEEVHLVNSGGSSVLIVSVGTGNGTYSGEITLGSALSGAYIGARFNGSTSYDGNIKVRLYQA